MGPVQKLRWRFLSVWPPLLIGLVLIGATGAIAYVHIAVKRIEEELPLRVMEEKRDMERIARNFYEFLVAVDAAQTHPTEGNVSSLRDHLGTVENDLETLRERYTFDTLIGASALHAVISPAVDDARIWLTEGFGSLKPSSPILLDLVATRIRETMSRVYDKTTEADRIAFEILEQQTVSLRQLRGRLILVVAVVAIFAGGLIWLALRQQRIVKAREVALSETRRARDDAEAALADLRMAQQRLIQAEKMASLGQVTAGIAHEIKNPLNFVNNFSKLSDELLDELAKLLEEPIKSLGEEERDDAEGLLATVRQNLSKISEHGHRADSIVKNMLLHSREGPSEQRFAKLNSIAEEALNLAYHGARAENQEFNIEIKKSLDEQVGEIECFPQDIMRVFLNLITNGMYAANQRLDESGGAPPEISVTTRAVNGRVEIEVRDNGAGIPADMREKIFIPFFTTKPAGEGTGLGLTLSYDIVVKQHGGDLTVESEPGEFTTFKVSLPRTLPVTGGNGRSRPES